MANEIISQLRAEYAREAKLGKRYLKQLEKLAASRGMRLKRVRHGKRWYYHLKMPNGKWKYLGNDDNAKVKKIKEARQLEESIEQIEKNKLAMETFANTFKVPDVGLLKIPKTYQSMVVLETNNMHTKAALEWLDAALNHKSKYEIKYPEELKHITNDGTRVRSKSEVIIYNLLLELGMIFVYELPMLIDGTVVVPDFTVYDEMNDEVYILEHLGMLDNREYVEMVSWKLQKYHKSGYHLGDKLILTSDSEDGKFNSHAIKKMLEGIFLKTAKLDKKQFV